MNDREGVIKYRLDHQSIALSENIDLNELNAWRSLLHRLNLIDQVADRYDGLGFGNISRRLVPDSDAFLISGTQTGHLATLERKHFALIKSASPSDNCLTSLGLSQPSSEALTHAGLYQQNSHVQAVIHVHSPEIWRHTTSLHLAHTCADIAYGTPAMAAAVKQLFVSGQLTDQGIFCMLGHQDGVVAFGGSISSAANLLIACLAKAIEVEQNQLSDRMQSF